MCGFVGFGPGLISTPSGKALFGSKSRVRILITAIFGEPRKLREFCTSTVIHSTHLVLLEFLTFGGRTWRKQKLLAGQIGSRLWPGMGIYPNSVDTFTKACADRRIVRALAIGAPLLVARRRLSN